MRPLAEIADAAVGVFGEKGFRPTGISDVAAVLGLSHGALYTYADSKQALLCLALLRAIDPPAVDALTAPVSAPAPEEIVALVKGWTGRQGKLMDLGRSGVGGSELPIEQEFDVVIDALYGFIEDNRRVIKLVAQCAAELPELSRWYFVQWRRSVFQGLSDYLQQQIADGRLRPVPDVAVAARFIVETIAWFAMHRHGDPDSAMLDDAECRRTVGHLLSAAFLPPVPHTAPFDDVAGSERP
jgi:AcrR family transcriptional regulator